MSPLRFAIFSSMLIYALSSIAQVSFERIRSFGFLDQLGVAPNTGVIEGNNGLLYGTTFSDGIANQGLVFRMAKDGSGYTSLHQFTGTGGDGSHPVGELLEASDGVIYGTTRDAGTGDNGTIFKINKDGTGYTVLLRFDGAAQGSSPNAGLIEGSDGKLYGTTALAGSGGFGTVFRINKDGSGYQVLHPFAGSPTDGSDPRGRLLRSSAGVLYGTTFSGGSSGGGVIFKLNTDGTGYAVLRHLSAASDGRQCTAGLLQATNHLLFGVASVGGPYNRGTLFSMDTNGAAFTVVHPFAPGSDGQNPYAELAQGPGGVIFGSTYTGGDFINGLLFKINADGAGYAVVHQFNYTVDNAGYRPEGVLWLSGDGFFYGGTILGGLANEGTIYRIKPDGSQYEQLRFFTFSGGDGYDLTAPVLEASDGKLYGMANEGGVYESGVVFKLNKDGSGYSILHHFSWQTDDASNPFGGLTEGNDGILYGATGFGGGSNMGTIFKINKDGSAYTILKRFTGTNGSGSYPSTTLLEASDGKLYARTAQGGTINNGATIFRIDKNGSNFEVIYSFSDNAGWLSDPEADLLEGADGALYSTSLYEGASFDGTVWKINKNGTGFTVLHTFNSTTGDGYWPDGSLLQRADGVLYGTASAGGTYDAGTLFKLNPDGSGYATVHSFNRTNFEGEWPRGKLLEAGSGVLLGVTYVGGLGDQGVLYAFGIDGGHYSVLRDFLGLDGAYPVAGLSRGRDGTLYGTTSSGGEVDLGVIYRMAPFKVGGYFAGPSFHLTINGSPGQVYAIDASDAFPTWAQLGRVTNLTGTVEWVEPLSGHPKRNFRARWLLP